MSLTEFVEVSEEMRNRLKHVVKDETDAIDVQIGGDHYKSLAIQPIEYCYHNNLNVCQSKVIKYITRYPNKGGLEDLKKAKHMIDLIIEFEYKDA